MASLNKLGIVYEELDPQEIKTKFPVADIQKYGHVKCLDDLAFGKPTGNLIEGATYVPESGYITDPQLSTHNAQRATEAKGSKCQFNAEVVEIHKNNERVMGVTLKDGTRIDAPIVINVAGPHSFLINRMAGVKQGMKIKTRAIRVEVAHVPSPEGFDYENKGMMLSDGDIGNYS